MHAGLYSEKSCSEDTDLFTSRLNDSAYHIIGRAMREDLHRMRSFNDHSDKIVYRSHCAAVVCPGSLVESRDVEFLPSLSPDFVGGW